MVLDFEKACIDANVGEVTDPVKTQFGYHLIRLSEKTNPKQLELEDVKDEIKNILLKEKEKDIYVKRMDDLMKKANIVRNY